MKRHVEFFLICSSLLGFLVVLFFVLSGHTMWLDLRISYLIQWLICPILTNIMIIFTNFGSAFAILVLLSILFIVSFRHSKFFFYTKLLTLTLFVTTFVNVMVKELVDRPRPMIRCLISESGSSFPSGHSMVSLAFYGFLIFMSCTFLTGRKKNFLCFGLGLCIFLIGLSRIYLGVHYFTDVLGGFLLGMVILMVMILCTKKYASMEQKS